MRERAGFPILSQGGALAHGERHSRGEGVMRKRAGFPILSQGGALAHGERHSRREGVMRERAGFPILSLFGTLPHGRRDSRGRCDARAGGFSDSLAIRSLVATAGGTAAGGVMRERAGFLVFLHLRSFGALRSGGRGSHTER
jgi:hypothetical protein